MFTSDMRAVKQLGFPAPDSISWTLYLPDLRTIAELLPEPTQSGLSRARRFAQGLHRPLADNKSKVARDLVRAFLRKLAV